jgi:carboxylesterase type B
VFGDDYEFGSYNGSKLAAHRDVIVVESNYRLGSLGFLASSVRDFLHGLH